MHCNALLDLPLLPAARLQQHTYSQMVKQLTAWLMLE